MKIMPSLGLAAYVFTAACSGGGGGGVAIAPSYAELQQKNFEISNALNMMPGADDMPGSELPDSGGAKYAGVMSLIAAPTVILAGTMTLEADFGLERISGSATNFRDQNNTAFAGTLDILEGDVSVGNPNQALPTFVPVILGTLTSDTTTAAILGSLRGDFYGTDGNPAFVAGTISGTANVNGVLNNLTGTGFIAERTETN